MSVDSTNPPIQPQPHPRLLDIQPSSFRVDLQLHTDIFLDLTLTNLTPQLVTFKVKTTARDRYQLKPTQGYIPPHSPTLKCKVVLLALTSYPDSASHNQVTDKFLVQSLAVSGGKVADLGRFWKERESRHAVKEGRYAFAEQIVECQLNVPVAYGGGGGDGGSSRDGPSRMERAGGDETEREGQVREVGRDERRDETGSSGGDSGGGGGMVIVRVGELKDQQQPSSSAQKQQPTSSTNLTTQQSQQRTSYPPLNTATPTQPSHDNNDNNDESTTDATATQQPRVNTSFSSSSSLRRRRRTPHVSE